MAKHVVRVPNCKTKAKKEVDHAVILDIVESRHHTVVISRSVSHSLLILVVIQSMLQLSTCNAVNLEADSLAASFGIRGRLFPRHPVSLMTRSKSNRDD